jgi:hypothetical protein
MTEPIKLPPYLLAGTLVREGVNKHRARDIEQWMNEEVALAVEKATAELLRELTILQRWYADVSMRAEKAEAEVERLREANEATRNAGFVEASRIHGKEIERLRAALEYAVSQNEHDMLLTGEECRAARNALKEPK